MESYNRNDRYLQVGKNDRINYKFMFTSKPLKNCLKFKLEKKRMLKEIITY